MLTGLRRMFRAVRGGLDPQGIGLIDRFLNEPEKLLFFQMEVWDQYHAVQVARFCLDSALTRDDVRLMVLIKAALLHDAGKVRGYAGIVMRLFVSLTRRISPRLRDRWAIRDGSRLNHAFYIDKYHAARGAYMARSLGVSEPVARLIREHHKIPQPEDSSELQLLQLADSRS